nr:peroxygenase 1 [Quercus suber]
MAALMEREALATKARHAPVTYEREVRDDLEVSLPKPFSLWSLVIRIDDIGLGLKHGFLVGRFESNSGDGVGLNLIGGLAVAGDADDVGGRQ